MAKGTIIYMGIFELPDKNAAAHRVINNGKVFTALGYRVVYLGTVKGEWFSGIRKSDYDDNIYEEAYPQGTKNWISHLFDIKNIDSVAEKYADTCLVITYNVPLVTYKAVKKTFAKKNIKVAYDCTEWNDYTVGSFPKRFYKKIDEKQIRTKLHKNCDDIIIISSMMERQYQGNNLLKLPPLIDIDEPIWHQKVEKNKRVFEFCFAGTIGAKERIDLIINAFKGLESSSVILKIIGITREEYIQMYPEQNNDLDKRIVFMGRLSHFDTIRHVLLSDCYVFIRERTRQNQAGFPTKFAEAYTCGVPIISTDVSDIKYYSGDYVIVLEDLNESTIVGKMNYIYNNRIHRNKVKSTFDYHNFLRETERWLNNVFT